MNLKKYVAKTLSDIIPLLGDNKNATVTFELNVLSVYDPEKKEYVINVVSDDVSSSKVTFSVEI